jgi:hypothetical protein
MMTSYRHIARSLFMPGIVAGVSGLLYGTSAAADADADPLTGHYLVRHTTDVPAPLFIEIEARDGDEDVSVVLRCVLPHGEESEAIHCPQMDISAPVELSEAGQYASIVAVDFLPIEMRAESLGLEIRNIGEAEEPAIHGAEATWKGIPDGWECETEERDQTKCDTDCGGSGTVSAEPYPTNNWNPWMEPQCEVTCECPGGGDGGSTWIDPPAVVPAS